MSRFASLSPFAILAAAAAGVLAAPGFVPGAAAANATQQQCSQQYQAAKTAGTLNGEKWSQFYSECAARLKGSADASTGAATTAVAPVAVAPASRATRAAKTASAAAAPAAAGHQTTQQICSQQYQTAKSAGTLNGQKWPQYYSSCAASIKSYSPGSAAAPAEPDTTTAAAPASNSSARTGGGLLGGLFGKKTTTPTAPASANTNTASAPVSTVDKNGKPLTPGEIAFRQRIHECSQEWQSQKAAGTLNGAKWPQFWSQCNAQLKAQG